MSDFFLASGEDLSSLNFEPPFAGTAGLPDSEVDLLMLCNLESILTGSDWDCIFDSVYINPVAEQGPEGPWIYEVSAELLKALQSLGPADALDCARSWAETDEWTLRDNITIEKVSEVLQKLISLAQQALLQNKRLFIWAEA
ncbi:MAG: hypothetical protein K2X27_03855 [Candidatus Obscuribacterales bacterium]|nr:hypothetical protein [Candidatus Obscuribacterales bacterium]